MMAGTVKQQQRHLLKAANLEARFWLCFTINSEPLHGHATTFLGQMAPATAQQDPNSEDQCVSELCWVPRIWSFETQPYP